MRQNCGPTQAEINTAGCYACAEGDDPSVLCPDHQALNYTAEQRTQARLVAFRALDGIRQQNAVGKLHQWIAGGQANG